MSASIAFALLMMIGVPLGLVLTAAGLVGAVSIGGPDFLAILADRFFSGVSGYVLIAVPYFIITAEVMNRAGLTERLIAFAGSLFGRVPGALSHVNVTTCLLFAGLTGAAVTETAAIGRTLIPSMRREGYSASYCAAVTACAAIVGPIIPPSIIMIAYAATLRDISILGLFAAGIVPGLMMGGGMLLVSGLISWKRGFAGHERVRLARVLSTGASALAAMGIPLVILGGVLSGLTTVTEASVLACIYALVLGGLVYRRLGRRDMWEALVSTVSFSGVVFLLLGASNVLGWYVTRSGVARHAAEAIATMSSDPVMQILGGRGAVDRHRHVHRRAARNHRRGSGSGARAGGTGISPAPRGHGHAACPQSGKHHAAGRADAHDRGANSQRALRGRGAGGGALRAGTCGHRHPVRGVSGLHACRAALAGRGHVRRFEVSGRGNDQGSRADQPWE